MRTRDFAPLGGLLPLLAILAGCGGGSPLRPPPLTALLAPRVELRLHLRHLRSHVSLAPPPRDELTTIVPSGATRVRAAGTTMVSLPW